MNTLQASNIIEITIQKSLVSYKMKDDSLETSINTGLKNLVYPQFAAELAAENVLAKIGVLEKNAKLLKIDNSHWKLILSESDFVKESNSKINSEKEFTLFESQNYDFYLFSSLVKDVIINPNNIAIPYDMEMKIIYDSYMRLPEFTDEDSNPYDHKVAHIKSDKILEEDLYSTNENK